MMSSFLPAAIHAHRAARGYKKIMDVLRATVPLYPMLRDAVWTSVSAIYARQLYVDCVYMFFQI